jgi:hypothetical protein
MGGVPPVTAVNESRSCRGFRWYKGTDMSRTPQHGLMRVAFIAWGVMSGILTLIGIGGIPDALAQWGDWLNGILTWTTEPHPWALHTGLVCLVGWVVTAWLSRRSRRMMHTVGSDGRSSAEDILHHLPYSLPAVGTLVCIVLFMDSARQHSIVGAVSWCIGGSVLASFQILVSRVLRPSVNKNTFTVLNACAVMLQLKPGHDRLTLYRRHPIRQQHYQVLSWSARLERPMPTATQPIYKGLVGELLCNTMDDVNHPTIECAQFQSCDDMIRTYVHRFHYTYAEALAQKCVRLAMACPVPTRIGRTDTVLYFDTARQDMSEAERTKFAQALSLAALALVEVL